MATRSVIVGGARTPIGKISGGLSSLRAVDLGALAIAGAMQRAGVRGDQVDYVFMGQAIQAGSGQQTARQAAVMAGVPMATPSTTVNKVCLSGLHALFLADQLIKTNEASVVVAGGMESMSRAPRLLAGGGGETLTVVDGVDSVMHDGLYCSFDECSVGVGTERRVGSHVLTRQCQDTLALTSHMRAADATRRGRFDDEIVPVTVRKADGTTEVLTQDEGIRDQLTAERLRRLPPAFAAGGTITVGNASQLSDGAAAVVIASSDTADELGLPVLGEIVSYGMVAGPDASLLTQPSGATRRALEKAGLGIDDIDLLEINEAFAAVVVASMQDLGISHDIVNVNGGAIALGHPLAMSGVRQALTLLLELRRRHLTLGVAALCGGGGQGDAIVLRVVE